ncbi:MAG: hypothetical protein HYV07_23215 [Deltaproteobacteria bacterium]|nr:hypothetical protein [Deltaproteobacteria bacterium]
MRDRRLRGTWRASQGAVWLAVSAVLFGCSASRTVALELGSDELVLAVLLDDSGRFSDRGALLGGERLELEGDSDASLVAWAISTPDLRGIDGRSLSREVLEGLEVGDGKTGCGRCPMPAAEPPGSTALRSPQLLFEGVSCPVPPFARVVADESGVAASIRRLVRLEWPGECACPVARSSATPARGVSLTAVGAESWPITAAAERDDGLVGFFGEHVSALVPRQGEAIVRSGLALPGRVLAATGGAELLVAVHDPRADPHDVRVVSIGSRGEIERIGEALPLRPSTLLRSPGGSVVAFGGFGGREAGLLLCEDILRAGSCRELLGGALSAIDRSFESAVTSTTGLVVAVGSERGLLVLEGLPDEVASVVLKPSPQLVSRGVVVDSRGNRLRFHFEAHALEPAVIETKVAVNGADLYACIDGAFGSRLLFAHLDFEALRFEVLLEVPKARCKSALPREGGAILLLSDGSGVACGPGGCQRRTLSELMPGIERPAMLEPMVGGGALAFDADSAWIRRSGGPFERVYGRTGRAPGILVDFGDRILELGSEGVRIVEENGELRGAPIPLGAGLGVVAAADDPSGTEVALIARDSMGCGVVLFIDQGLAIERLELPASVGCPAPVAIKAVGPGHYLMAGESRLLALVGREVLEVEVEWDDPNTAAVEQPPDPTLCSAFTTIAAGRGGAVAAGCEGHVFRVSVYSRPPRATRAAFGLEGNPPGFSGATQDCADVGVLVAGGNDNGDLEQGRAYRMSPDGAEGGVAFEIERANDRAQASDRLRSAVPFAVLGSSAEPMIVFGDSLHRLGSASRVRLDGALITSAALRSDETVILETSSGAIFLGR